MDFLSVLNVISSTITIFDFAKKFIDNIGLDEDTALIQQTQRKIETFQTSGQNNVENLVEVLKQIPNLSVIKKETLEKCLLETALQYLGSNVANYNNSQGNTTQQIAVNAPIHGPVTIGAANAPPATKKSIEPYKKAIVNILENILNIPDEEAGQAAICLEVHFIGGANFMLMDDEKNTALLHLAAYNTQRTHKLSRDQIKFVLNIIAQLTPYIIIKKHITFEESNRKHIFFVIFSEQGKKIEFKEEISRDTYTICAPSENAISEKIQEIKIGDWDTLIYSEVEG